jgi:hypothetical protein
MVLAGGCGAGSIWRVGEGHVKLRVAAFFFAVGASATRQILVRTDVIGQVGSASFLPHMVGSASAAWPLCFSWRFGISYAVGMSNVNNPVY